MNSDSCRNISVVCLYKVLMIQTFAHETSFSPTQFQSLRSHIPDSVSISQTTVPSSALFAPSFLSSGWSGRKPGAHPDFREKIPRMFRLWTASVHRSPPRMLPAQEIPRRQRRGWKQLLGDERSAGPKGLLQRGPAQHQASLEFLALWTNLHPHGRGHQPQSFSGTVFQEGCQSGQEWPGMAQWKRLGNPSPCPANHHHWKEALRGQGPERRFPPHHTPLWWPPRMRRDTSVLGEVRTERHSSVRALGTKPVKKGESTWYPLEYKRRKADDYT